MCRSFATPRKLFAQEVHRTGSKPAARTSISSRSDLPGRTITFDRADQRRSGSLRGEPPQRGQQPVDVLVRGADAEARAQGGAVAVTAAAPPVADQPADERVR